MANKRISELVQITAPEMSTDDLLLLADITAHESKKLRLGDLNAFLLQTSNSGSLYGTSSWSQYAIYALSGPTPSTASYSLISGLAYSAISAIDAISASYARSGSYAITASYALSTPPQTVFSAAFADYARTASYLIYTPGRSNGTASFAMTASLLLGSASYALTVSQQSTSSYSYTSSYALYALTSAGGGGGTMYALSASWASMSFQALGATQSISTSFLAYSGTPNGTASYAIVAAGFPNTRVNYGVHLATTQSTFSSQIDSVNIIAINKTNRSSSFEALGTVIVPYTASVYATCSIELIALERWSGITSSLDRTPLEITLATGDTGSVLIPFSLMGEVPLSGSHLIYVTASQGAILSSARNVRFDVTSMAERVIVGSAETMSFTTIPVGGLHPLLTYTASGILTVGADAAIAAVADTVTEIDMSNKALSQIKYAWTLPILTKLVARQNSNLTDAGGMPNSLVTMSVANCALYKLAPLTFTSVAYLDVSDNDLLTLPPLPPSMMYINCSDNTLLNSLPEPLPSGVQVLLANNTALIAPPPVFPSTLISMSMNNNTAMSSWTTSFPTTLTYFDCSNTPFLTSLPSMPSSMKYLNVGVCSLTSISIDNLTTQLVVNGLSNGRLNIQGNFVGAYSPTTLANLSTLSGRGWTITS